MINKTYVNALAKETSPYLQQHATNPVDWYPWNEKSLALAKAENKPILLSIGYSACHWCHVMAHESFENEQIATIMNEHFINIKVDREERPDLDKIYQAAYQIMFNKPGGWPLTVFLSADDQIPFYAGTYFPAKAMVQKPAFPHLLQQLSAFYHSKKNEINVSKRKLKQSLDNYTKTPISKHNENSATSFDTKPFDVILGDLEDAYNRKHGGFGQTPKFPQFTSLECLIHHQYLITRKSNIDNTGLEMILFSLKRMAMGGVYDQLGGGICRYSVDDYWMIPHFEKMLYDNGPLLNVYAQAYQLCNHPSLINKYQHYSTLFKQIIEKTANWVIREMQSSKGGFYSSLDADTEGKEGHFYVWDRKEVKQLLNANSSIYAIVAAHYGLDQASNFEGLWNLHIYEGQDRETLAEQFHLPVEQINLIIEEARTVLFNHRQQRVLPGRDEKILTSWNALMIKGLAKAGRLLNCPEYIQAATQSLDFINNTLWVEHRLLATFKDGGARIPAYLDDYAFLLDSIIELLQSRWRSEDMNFAIQLADELLDKFEDKESGGFYFTAHDHEQLMTRPKSFSDESIPSGNAIAAYALGRLGHILGNTSYIDTSEKTLKAAWDFLQSMPIGHASLFLSLEDKLFSPTIIILRGDKTIIQQWKAVCQQHYSPNYICLCIDNSHTDLPQGLSDKKIVGDAVAYICSEYECQAPITSIDHLINSLKKK